MEMQVPARTDTYVIKAVVSLSLIAVAAIVIILIFRPAQDNTAIVAAILGFVTPTVFALMQRNGRRE